MKKYLKDAIQEAKGGNANQKVNIIAHSMGGLLARAYIQGEDYQNDVETLVMAGTPHTGSALAYYLWEGGDPRTVDNFSDLQGRYLVRYYTNTVNKLMQDSKWPLTGEQDYLNVRTFISQHVPTARQLLATDPFLDRGSGPEPLNINDDLKHLNNGSDEYIKYVKPEDRMGRPDNTTPGLVKTRVYYSNSENIVSTISVKNSTISGCYEDGQPTGSVSYADGDGTVKMTSATWPFANNWADCIQIQDECDHTSLIGKAKNLIADFLYPASTSALLSPRALAATSSAVFFITYDGWVQPYLADPQARAVGFDLME